MKVTLVNHSDTLGGASVVSLRLLEALCNEGIDTRMIVKNVHGPADSRIRKVTGGNAKKEFLLERVRIFASNGLSRSRLFKVSTGDRGLPIADDPWIADADVIVLNWFNQGMMSLDELRRLAAWGKPIVWTMHDMWAMTGICHHAGDCLKYRSHCGACPFLGRPHRQHDLSAKIFDQKAELYDDININFVAVSRWLADCASHSALLGNRNVEVIHNAFPLESFSNIPRRSRTELGLPDDGSRLIAMCAARLDDSIKDLPTAIRALNSCNAAEPICAVFCGDIRNPEILDTLEVPFVRLGKITDSDRLADIYAHCTAVISSSKFETLPTTLIEGMAAGAFAVGFGGDGRDEIIDHLSTGYLARKGDVADLAKGIEWAVATTRDKAELLRSVEKKFDSRAIAREYINLFERLLSTK